MRQVRKELEARLKANWKEEWQSIRDKAEIMLFMMDNDQGIFPKNGEEFETILMLCDMVEKYQAEEGDISIETDPNQMNLFGQEEK